MVYLSVLISEADSTVGQAISGLVGWGENKTKAPRNVTKKQERKRELREYKTEMDNPLIPRFYRHKISLLLSAYPFVICKIKCIC